MHSKRVFYLAIVAALVLCIALCPKWDGIKNDAGNCRWGDTGRSVKWGGGRHFNIYSAGGLHQQAILNVMNGFLVENIRPINMAPHDDFPSPIFGGQSIWRTNADREQHCFSIRRDNLIVQSDLVPRLREILTIRNVSFEQMNGCPGNKSICSCPTKV